MRKAILFLLFIIAVLLVGMRGDFPLNDDWQYAYPVQQLMAKGELEMQGFFAPNIILQVYWGYLFCWLAGSFSFTWLRLSTLVLAFLGALVFHRLARRLDIAPPLAFLGALALLFNPLYFSLSFSFMTDVPFLAVLLLSLYAFERHIQLGRPGWLLAALLLSIAAYLIRQPGIVLLPAFGIWKMWERRGSANSIALAAVLSLAAVAVYLAYERLGKPWLGISGNFVPVSERYLGQLVDSPLSWLAEIGRRIVKTWIYLGFFALPLLPFLAQRLLHSRLMKWKVALPLLAANLALLAFLYQIDKLFPFGGNILYNFGLGPELLADVYTLGLANTPRLPEWSMLAINFLSQLSATALLWAAVFHWKSLSRTQQRFFTFLLLANALYLPAMSITSFFDRYLLLPIASTFLLFLALSSGPIRWPKLLPLLLMSLFSLLATHDYLAWNRARHQAFQWLQQEGIPIEKIDAGFEYNGFYNYHENRILEEGRSFWWVTEDEWMITFGPVPGCRQVKTFGFRRWLWGGKGDWKLEVGRRPPSPRLRRLIEVSPPSPAAMADERRRKGEYRDTVVVTPRSIK